MIVLCALLSFAWFLSLQGKTNQKQCQGPLMETHGVTHVFATGCVLLFCFALAVAGAVAVAVALAAAVVLALAWVSALAWLRLTLEGFL